MPTRYGQMDESTSAFAMKPTSKDIQWERRLLRSRQTTQNSVPASALRRSLRQAAPAMMSCSENHVSTPSMMSGRYLLSSRAACQLRLPLSDQLMNTRISSVSRRHHAPASRGRDFDTTPRPPGLVDSAQ